MYLGIDLGNLSKQGTGPCDFDLGVGVMDRLLRPDLFVPLHKQNAWVWRYILALCWNMSHRVRLRVLARARDQGKDSRAN